MARLLVLTLSILALGCGAATEVDHRFDTPEATVTTLLQAYDLADVSQEDIRARMASRGRFTLRDRSAYEACFTDLSANPADEGLAGFVVGALAAGKDELRVTRDGDRATVSPREGVEIVMRRDDEGAFRIVLSRSVPTEVRARIAAVASHAEGRIGRGLPTID